MYAVKIALIVKLPCVSNMTKLEGVFHQKSHKQQKTTSCKQSASDQIAYQRMISATATLLRQGAYLLVVSGSLHLALIS